MKKLEEEQKRREAREDANMMQAPKKFQPVEYAREPSPEDKLLKSLVKSQLQEKEQGKALIQPKVQVKESSPIKSSLKRK